MASKKNNQKFVTLDAFDLSREGVGLFLTAVRPSEIFPYTRVSRVDEDVETGFQRALEIHRVKKYQNI